MKRIHTGLLAMIALSLAGVEPDEDAYRPHTPTLIFRLHHADEEADRAAIRASVLKQASVVKVAFVPGAVQVRFDSHIVSYHQIAQAIAGGGVARGKTYDPTLKLTVPDYAKADNAAKVDAVLAGKRRNQRVRIEVLDRTRGEFLLHFLPLEIDPENSQPQGFNGGHLHHPISDEVPRGLGLPCGYEEILHVRK